MKWNSTIMVGGVAVPVEPVAALDMLLATIAARDARIAELTAERDAWELEAGQHEATVAARDAEIDRLHRCCDHHKAECNNLAAIIRDKDAQLERALDALQDLFDEQQGPPLELPRHKASWQAAMDKARTVLAKWPPEEQNND